MIQKILFVFLCVFAFYTAQAVEVHAFAGEHFLASYLDCDLQAICDIEQLMEAMDGAVGLSGATILNKNHYIFEPNGLTAVYLLSESHASIHTYPEFGTCFVDLFTCGSHCSAEAFDEALRAYLKPKIVNALFLERCENINQSNF